MKVKIVKEVKRSDGLWRFACGDVFIKEVLKKQFDFFVSSGIKSLVPSTPPQFIHLVPLTNLFVSSCYNAMNWQFKGVFIALDMPKTLQTKSKTCFGSPGMILYVENVPTVLELSRQFQYGTDCFKRICMV